MGDDKTKVIKCPYRMEALIKNVPPDVTTRDLFGAAATCMKEECAMWGTIERGWNMETESFKTVQGCRRTL